MATGLLIVGLGHATRLLGHLAGKDKQYTAMIRLGQATTTDDAEGDPLGVGVDATWLPCEVIEQAMSSYMGTIDQVPSTVSAIKVDGKRAYARARAGEEIHLKPRAVNVSRFEMDSRVDDPPWVDLAVTVDCSAGTYIRALGRDLGNDLKVGGHLTALRRTRVGKLSVDDAVTLDHVGIGSVLAMGVVAPHIAPRVDVGVATARDVAVGRAINVHLPGDLASIFSGSRLLALYRPDPTDANLARPVAVFVDPIRHGGSPS